MQTRPCSDAATQAEWFRRLQLLRKGFKGLLPTAGVIVCLQLYSSMEPHTLHRVFSHSSWLLLRANQRPMLGE
jgi:hypothetical protein